MTLRSLVARRAFLGGLALASASRPARAAESYTMRLNVNEAATSAFARTAFHFAAEVERRSNGQLKVEVYPNHQLATQQESINALVTGVLDFAIEATAFMAPFLPRLQAFDMPFLFKNAAAAYRVFDGAIGAEFSAELETKGIAALGWTGNFKELSTVAKAVALPGDMKGLRIRIPNGAVFVATYQALGAIPVTIDVAESYMALMQRTVDGIDLNLDLIVAGEYYNVIKHVAMLDHIFSVTLLLGSKRKLDGLPPGLQKIVRDEGKSAIAFWRATAARELAETVATLKAKGVAFSRVPYAPFRAAVEPVYAAFSSKLGADFLDRVIRAAG